MLTAAQARAVALSAFAAGGVAWVWLGDWRWFVTGVFILLAFAGTTNGGNE